MMPQCLKKHSIFSAILLFLTSYSPLALAKPAEGWHLLIAPYGWMSALNVDLRIQNHSADLSVPFSEILKHLDFAAQGHIEAGYGPWTLMLDPTYLKVTDNHRWHTIGLSLTSKTTLIDAGIFYRLFSKTLSPNSSLTFECLGGLRHLGIENSLRLAQTITLSDSTEMTAPILGARFKVNVSKKVGFWLRGDVGGFSVEHLKETWSSTLGFSYAIKPHIELGLAYRVLKINYNHANSSMNLLMYGPMAGIGFQF